MKTTFIALAALCVLCSGSSAQDGQPTQRPPLQVQVTFTDPELGALYELINDGVKNPSLTLQQSVDKTTKAAVIYDKIRMAIMAAQAMAAQPKPPAPTPEPLPQ